MSKVLVAVQVAVLALLMIAVLAAADMIRSRLSEPTELEIKMLREAQLDRIKSEYIACRARGDEVVLVLDGDVICLPKKK